MSYTLKYTGAEIDDILDRAVEGGTIDEALALKAPLESPALTGTPTAPTPAESDNSTKVATTAYADRAAAGAAAAAYPVDTASGAIASFADGADAIPMKSFVCSIDPVQNLNGQSAPYPAGGGKNKLPLPSADTVNGVTLAVNADGSITLTGTASSTATFDFVAAGNFDSTAYAGYIFSGGANWAGSSNGYSVRVMSGNTASQVITANETAIVDNGSGLRLTLRVGSGTSFPSGGLILFPMLRASGTDNTFAPYSNVCQISGHSGVKAVRTGVNLVPARTNRTPPSHSDVTYTVNSDGSVSLSGTATATSYFVSGWNAAIEGYFLKAGTYYISGGSNAAKVYLGYRKADGSTSSSSRDSGSGVTVTFTEDVEVYIQIVVAKDTVTDGITVYPMISNQSGQAWTPYIGTTYPVTFYDGADPLTVYKGSVDLVSGVLTVDTAYYEYDGTNFTPTDHTSGSIYMKLATNTNYFVVGFAPFTNIAKGSAASTTTPGYAYCGGRGIYFTTSDALPNAAALTTLATNTPVQIVMKLSTPLVYNLTPTQVLSLLGKNNCYNDCGDTAVEYRADIALYVQKYLGGNVSTLSMSAPTPSLSLGRTGVLLEPEALEPVITEDAEPDLAEEEPEEPEAEEE